MARRQHGVVTREQLVALGSSEAAIRHRVATGRLHLVWPRVYAVGRPALTREGRWMAAVLTCGAGSVLSHLSAGQLWGFLPPSRSWPEVSIPSERTAKRRRVCIHRRRHLAGETVTAYRSIPVTAVALTLTDLATRLTPPRLERAVNEADRLDLLDPEALRQALDRSHRRPGIAALRKLLDSRTFSLTDSELERRFLPLVRAAGLARPLTGARVNGFRVDFYWPALDLVVETDGLRYHRTPGQQAADRRRDQVHTAAGVTSLRFTRAQVVFEPGHVIRTLAAVAGRLGENQQRLGHR